MARRKPPEHHPSGGAGLPPPPHHEPPHPPPHHEPPHPPPPHHEPPKPPPPHHEPPKPPPPHPPPPHTEPPKAPPPHPAPSGGAGLPPPPVASQVPQGGVQTAPMLPPPVPIDGDQVEAAADDPTASAAKASKTQWITVGATVFDGCSGSCHNLCDGRFYYAELGTATVRGLTGYGWVAKAFGFQGELPCGTGLWVRLRGRTTYMEKGDRGYGQGAADERTPSDSHWAVDLHREVANYLGFNGKENIEIALRIDNLADAPGNKLIKTRGGGTPHALQHPTGLIKLPQSSGDFTNWHERVKNAGKDSGKHGTSLKGHADKLRKVMHKGTHFDAGHGHPHITDFVNLTLPPEHLKPPPTPKPLKVGEWKPPATPRRGVVKPGGGWVPEGAIWIRKRQDQGQDFETNLHGPVVAPGNGHVVHHLSDKPWPAGFGSPYVVVWIDDGPWANAMYYLGHCNEAVIPEGRHFRCGEVLARANHSLDGVHGWVELGLAPGGYPPAWGGSSSIYDKFKPTQVC